ncbi:MAG TPA: sigma-70 family RNA polymerase sigma factor [Thermodesulfobacteriota bacterium]|nr:sigma-70 family RNA polymerase sigma factor [Thermodesulfobacteriota bacterium]
MKGINIAVEELAIQEGSKHFYSAGNKTAAIPDSSVRRNSYSNGIINHKESSDEELIRRFMETQDEEAFNEIVNRYADKIFRLALRITHNTSDADDVLQEVFLTMEKLDTFRGESKFSTWLYRVAANAGYIQLRDRKKICDNEVSLEDYSSYGEYGTLEGIQIKDWSKLPDEVLLSKEAMEVIEGAVNELPLSYRVVFHLRDVEGLTNPEVAKVLDLSVTAVKARIHRARLFLRDKLSDYFYE